MSTALSIPPGATILTLDTATLLQVIQTANSVITPYTEALDKYGMASGVSAWLEACANTSTFSKLPSPEEYSLMERKTVLEFLENNLGFKMLPGDAKMFRDGRIPKFNAKKALKSGKLPSIVYSAQQELNAAQANLDAQIEYVNLIPTTYRFPLALDKVYSYLSSFLAETWKEAANLFEEQLHRWKIEASSAEALAIQAQTAILAEKASSRAGTAALFSGLNFFFK